MFRSEGIAEWGNAAVQGERRAVDVRVYFDSWAIFTFVLLSRNRLTADPLQAVGFSASLWTVGHA